MELFLPWRYKLSPWGTGSAARRICAVAALVKLLELWRRKGTCLTHFSSAETQLWCTHFFPSLCSPSSPVLPWLFQSLPSEIKHSSPITCHCEPNPNSPSAAVREYRNQNTWCWVNLSKIRAKPPYQLIGIRNSDCGELSRHGFLCNFQHSVKGSEMFCSYVAILSDQRGMRSLDASW